MDELAQLFLWPGRLLWLTPHNSNRLHRHVSATLLIARSGHFKARIGATREHVYAGLLIAANAPFAVEARSPQAVLHVDPDVPEFAVMSNALGARVFRKITAAQLKNMRAELASLGGNELSCEDAWCLFDAVIRQLGADSSRPAPPIDPRVCAVAHHIRQRMPASTPIADLSTLSDLSASRLMHLFKKQVGVPLRRFQLCVRAHYAATLLAQGQSLAQTAIDAGFADQAHATRTIRAVYGLTPAHFTGETRVRHCEPPHPADA